MLGTRYEEHISFDNNIPFKLFADIERPSTKYSFESNWHDNLEIQLCTDGEGYVLLDGNKIDITKNDIVIVNSNVLHFTSTNSKIKYTCLILDQKFCRESGIEPSKLFFKEFFNNNLFVDKINEIVSVYTNDFDICRTAKLRKLILDLLIILREEYTDINIDIPTKSGSYKTVRNAILYIRNNYSAPLSLEVIAKNVFVDKYTLSRLFKKLTGQTVVEYINCHRCNKAAQMIVEGESIESAAYACGFNNKSFFTKTFKKYMGNLPSHYKKR